MQRWAASQESGELETMRLQGRLRRQGGGSKVALQSLRNAFRVDLEKKLVDKDRTINLPTCVSTINKMLKEVYPNGVAEPEVKHAIRRAIRSYSATPRPGKRPIYMGKDCVSQAVLKSMIIVLAQGGGHISLPTPPRHPRHPQFIPYLALLCIPRHPSKLFIPHV